MIENIFSPTFGNRPQYIVGREGVISDFMEGLSSRPGHPYRATFFIGQRGMGKTALLLDLADRAEKIDFVTVCVAAGERMLDEIIEGIQLAGARDFGKRAKAVKSVSAGAFGFSVGLAFTEEVKTNYGFRFKLTLLCEALEKQKKGVLLLVDEVRASSPQMRELATTYQHLVGEGKNIAFAMAGLPNAISLVLNDDILTFLNRAHKVHLDLLPLNDISIYYTNTFRSLGIVSDSEILDAAAAATKGYPYLLQLVGYNIIRYMGETVNLTREILDLAVSASKRALDSDIFSPCLKGLSAEDKRFLNAMAEDLEVSRVSDLRERLNVTPSHIQTYKQRLIEAEVIDSQDRGEVVFSIPYLGEYLRGEI